MSGYLALLTYPGSLGGAIAAVRSIIDCSDVEVFNDLLGSFKNIFEGDWCTAYVGKYRKDVCQHI